MLMKILFLVYHGFSEVSGISKKIHYQVKGLRENGHEVHLCYYDFSAEGHRCRFVDGAVLKDYGQGMMAGLRQRIDFGCIYDYCRLNGIEFVYARCFQNANPWLIRFFRKLRMLGVKCVTEIPTYPYDQEFAHFALTMRMGLKVDQLFRRRLYKNMDAVVTFSDAERRFRQHPSPPIPCPCRRFRSSDRCRRGTHLARLRPIGEGIGRILPCTEGTGWRSRT